MRRFSQKLDDRRVPGPAPMRLPAGTGSMPATASAADRSLAVVTAAVAFGAYLATIYPGLTGIGDASKFSFVGRILGTPHAPGYPLYIWTSYLFSHVPWGTLAYRMNAFSAIWAAVAVGLQYLIARRLGTRRVIAISTALALGLGHAFWSRALYAKGYTLNAALVSAGILALLIWSDTRRRRHLLWAVAIFALSLGDHLTVLALVPALILFALLTDWRVALRPSTIAAALVLVALGFSQYLLILLRTLQGAPYLEASATNLQQLWRVMTARRFAMEIGAFSFSTLWYRRLPAMAGLLTTEVGVAGLLLLAAGLIVLVLRRWRLALLLAGGACGVLLLTANMSSNEDEGFLLSVFVLVWPVIGVGFERLAASLGSAPVLRRAAPALVGAAALCLPVRQVLANYATNDHHTETFEATYFDLLFKLLPDKTVIVNDEYRLNMNVLYKLHGEGAAGPRDIVLASADPKNLERLRREGYLVLAFDYARTGLSQYGLHFEPFEIRASREARLIMGQRPLSRLVSASVCYDTGNTGWRDLAGAFEPNGRINIRIDNYRPFDSDVTIYAGADRALSPVVVGGVGAGTPMVTIDTYSRRDPEAAARLTAHVAADQVVLPGTLVDSPFVSRINVRVNDRGGSTLFGIDLGANATAVIGRTMVDLNNPKRATVCSHPLSSVDAWPPDQPRAVLQADTGKVDFNDGWYSIEHRPADGLVFRWTTDRAVLVVPLAHRRGAVVRIVAEPLNYPGRSAGSMTLVVNHFKLPPEPLPEGRTTLSWSVPVEHWRDGLNEVVLEVDGARRPADVGLSPDRRLLGASVSEIVLDAIPDSGARSDASARR